MHSKRFFVEMGCFQMVEINKLTILIHIQVIHNKERAEVDLIKDCIWLKTFRFMILMYKL